MLQNDDFPEPTPFPMDAGGMGADPEDFEPTLTQSEKQWKMLLRDFGMPEETQARFFSLINHHLQLGKIQTREDLLRYQIKVDDILRVADWDDSQPELSPSDRQQIIFFVEWLMNKSYEGGTPTERVLLVSQFRNVSQKSEEIGGVPKSSGGLLSRIFGR